MLNNMFSINVHMLEETGAPKTLFNAFPNPFFIIRNKHLFWLRQSMKVLIKCTGCRKVQWCSQLDKMHVHVLLPALEEWRRPTWRQLLQTGYAKKRSVNIFLLLCKSRFDKILEVLLPDNELSSNIILRVQ